MNPAWTALFGHRVTANGECLEFQGARLPAGYGKLSYQSRTTTAHRVSWALANVQPLPDPSVVIRHHCDNPPCIRPDHLVAGTHADNSRDRVKRGRHRSDLRPENSSTAVLNWDSVAQIRAARRDGVSVRELAEQYGVTRGAIYDVLSFRNWKPERAPEVSR